ncbi:MAG: hypothetical protein INQ03_11385 [Candidatus Heimdallarchaeota archaeon]|nr:hypothetical protein [Candidatus Heimdallarchaeota archaeon]
MREQGIMLRCVYCTEIFPDIKECPKCDGKKEFFRPARMMDKYTSQRELVMNLKEFFSLFDEKCIYEPHLPEEDAQRMYFLIEKLGIYNFNLRETLIDLLRESQMK